MFELFVLIPLSVFFFFKNKAIAYVVATSIGVFILSLFSVEYTAGNFNRSECIYNAFWAGVIAVAYAGIFFLLTLFTRLLKRIYAHKKEKRDEK